MDKLRLLKEFEKLALTETLETDEIRLYLLLLSNSGRRMHGRIASGTLKDALGKRFSAAGLKRACRRLSDNGLIEVLSPSLNEFSDENFNMAYRIVPLAGERRR